MNDGNGGAAGARRILHARIELLRKIRESDQFRDSIVFVLTTSNDEQDKIDAYNLNVAGYMLKTDMGTSFQRAIALIDNYWKVVEFPGPD